jgi:hypothetical protein
MPQILYCRYEVIEDIHEALRIATKDELLEIYNKLFGPCLSHNTDDPDVACFKLEFDQEE